MPLDSLRAKVATNTKDTAPTDVVKHEGNPYT